MVKITENIEKQNIDIGPKTIIQKNRFWANKNMFVKCYEILNVRLQQIDVGCLKLSRMIPGTENYFKKIE